MGARTRLNSIYFTIAIVLGVAALLVTGSVLGFLITTGISILILVHSGDIRLKQFARQRRRRI